MRALLLGLCTLALVVSGYGRYGGFAPTMMGSLESLFGRIDRVISSDDDSEGRLAEFASLPANYTNTSSVVEHINNTTIVMNTTIVKLTINNSTLVVVLKSKEVSGPSQSLYCDSDADCADDEFCDRGFLFFMNKCQTCTPEGGYCTSNQECCNNQSCVLGECMDALYGSEGMLCASSDDCSEDLCCAFSYRLGQKVCKPLAREGEACHRGRTSVLDFGNLFGLPSRSCPCIGGLQCRSAGGFFSFFRSPVCVAEYWGDGSLQLMRAYKSRP